jgi:hypothetical protein
MLQQEVALPLMFVPGPLVAHPVHRRYPEVIHLQLVLANTQIEGPVS